ncbi:PorV/PorQ family protein [candidate division KSB1 bacterium]|nr:PorV/PorQ family protein [candidate division KSB1 bacterium]
MKNNSQNSILIFLVFTAILWFTPLHSADEWGGINDIFDLPVGAKAMGMGGAYVAAVNDPYALYWNAAALEQVSNISLALYMNSLPTGAQYNYVAYAHPTLFKGTFSAGWMRISIDDIEIRSAEDGSYLGSQNYGRDLFLFGYAFNLVPNLYIGTTLKIERSVFPGPENELTLVPGRITDSAFGADIGFLYTPPFDSPFFQNTKLGMNIQNAVKRTSRLIEMRESTPRNYRVGLYRLFPLNELNSFALAFEVDKNEKASIPMQFSMGAEYGFYNSLFLRSGYADGHITFGAGLEIIGVNLDYSFWSAQDVLLDNSHRISVTLNIGKSREERQSLYQQKQMEQWEQEIRQKVQIEEQRKINESWERAETAFELENYDKAFFEITKVLSFAKSDDDPEFTRARLFRDEIIRKQREVRKEQERLFKEREQEQAQRRASEQTIRQHHQNAIAYYEEENYPAAISECDMALQLNPKENLAAPIRDLRSKAQADMGKKIDNLVARGAELAAQGRNGEAIEIFSQAKGLAEGYPAIESNINNRIRVSTNNLNYEGLFRRATLEAQKENWAEAARLYEQALRYQPNNSSLQKRYKEAEARANARDMEMTPEVEDLFSKGSTAMIKGNLEEALQYYERAKALQPYNRKILRGIDYIREEIATKEKATQDITNN